MKIRIVLPISQKLRLFSYWIELTTQKYGFWDSRLFFLMTEFILVWLFWIILIVYYVLSTLIKFRFKIWTLQLVNLSALYLTLFLGPYYRYRTYRDYFDMPFKNYANCNDTTLEKLKYTVMYAVIYLVANSIWPLEVNKIEQNRQKYVLLIKFSFTVLFNWRIC